MANDGEGRELEIKEEESVEVEQTPLFYTKAFGHYQQSPCSKKLNHTSVVQ